MKKVLRVSGVIIDCRLSSPPSLGPALLRRLVSMETILYIIEKEQEAIGAGILASSPALYNKKRSDERAKNERRMERARSVNSLHHFCISRAQFSLLATARAGNATLMFSAAYLQGMFHGNDGIRGCI